MVKENLKNPEITRSFIIPVLDYSPHSPYNVTTLLDDLESIHGEVICIFNSHEVSINSVITHASTNTALIV